MTLNPQWGSDLSRPHTPFVPLNLAQVPFIVKLPIVCGAAVSYTPIAIPPAAAAIQHGYVKKKWEQAKKNEKWREIFSTARTCRLKRKIINMVNSDTKNGPATHLSTPGKMMGCYQDVNTTGLDFDCRRGTQWTCGRTLTTLNRYAVPPLHVPLFFLVRSVGQHGNYGTQT